MSPRAAASMARRRGGPQVARPPRTAWHSADVLLLAVVGVLVVVGLVMVLSASSVQALRQYGSSWLFFRRQLLYGAGGAAALVVTARVDYRRWRALATPLLAIAGVLLVAVLVPGVGVTVSGSQRWIQVGPVGMQPAEVAKLALVLFAADLLARRADRIEETAYTLKPMLIVLGLLAVLVMKEPDMGTTLVLGSIGFAILFVAGIPLLAMGGVMGAAASAAFVVGMAEPYRKARLLSFLDPWADKTNTGYQVVQSLVGLGSGRLAGVGLGASRAKWGFLPNAHTDFIFAIIGEELGLVGSLIVVALFLTFAALGVRAALRAPDRFGTLVAAGITAWIAGQAFINIGAVIGILPVTGVPLPLVSYGGSSLVIVLAAVGVLFNISRQARPVSAAEV